MAPSLNLYLLVSWGTLLESFLMWKPAKRSSRIWKTPLGEALRSGQARRSSPAGHYSQKSKYDSNVSGQSSFGSSPAADNIEKEMLPRYEPIPFSASMNESTPTGITDHIAQGPDPILEESPKRKSITYEELRNKNRESYEVTLSQKAEPQSGLCRTECQKKKSK